MRWFIGKARSEGYDLYRELCHDLHTLYPKTELSAKMKITEFLLRLDNRQMLILKKWVDRYRKTDKDFCTEELRNQLKANYGVV